MSKEVKSVRIIIVDDHNMMRSGLRLALGKVNGFVVVGEAADGQQGLVVIVEEQPDVVLLDVNLPDIHGIEMLRRILVCSPESRIIMLSSDISTKLVADAFQAGASGYVIKSNSMEELERAVVSVMAGKEYLCPEASTVMIQIMRRGTQPHGIDNRPLLSAREQEVLRHVVEGLRNKEIAEKIGVGVKSVETYRARLLEKLQLTSTAELIRYAIREGIIKA